MSITLDLPANMLSDLRSITAADDDAVAVTEAVREYIRLRRLQELKSASGKIEFSEGWKEMDAAEFDDYSS